MEKTKIMVVEDEVVVATDIKTTLIGFGYEVCAMATTGEVAIKNAEESNPDLILMDIDMS